MTNDEMRIAIAESQGWVWYRLPKDRFDCGRVYRCLFHPSIREYEGQSPEWLVRADGSERICNTEYLWRESHIPDLTLDWINDIERAMSDDDYHHYLYQLFRVIENTTEWEKSIFSLKAMAIRATKEQKAEALINHWTAQKLHAEKTRESV